MNKTTFLERVRENKCKDCVIEWTDMIFELIDENWSNDVYIVSIEFKDEREDIELELKLSEIDMFKEFLEYLNV